MTHIFNGKDHAQKIKDALVVRVDRLRKELIIPKMVSIVVGNIGGAMKYQEMKKKAGESLGIAIDIRQFSENASVSEIAHEIKKLNMDKQVHGVMVQLPLPPHFTKDDRSSIIETIDPNKDVDGMREDSRCKAPVVEAVIQSIHTARETSTSELRELSVAVVGAYGFEGRKMVREIEKEGYAVEGIDKDSNLSEKKHVLSIFDVIVSCTGHAGLITGDMVREGVIAIDVGAPEGDFDFESVSPKAHFITPVPGGIGPVTIALLMDNLVTCSESSE